MNTQNDRLIETKEAAKILGRHVSVLAKWRREGRGPEFVQYGPRTFRYAKSVIEAYKRDNLDELAKNQMHSPKKSVTKTRKSTQTVSNTPAHMTSSGLSPISEQEKDLRITAIVQAMQISPDAYEAVRTAKTIYSFLKNPE